MPDGRGRAERRLECALDALLTALRACEAPWMVIGGIAAIARGVRRLTTDVDAVVRGDAVGIKPLIRALAKQGIKPRIRDAAPFADENLVLLLSHEPTGVDIDLSLGWTEFEHRALEQCEVVAFGNIRAPMARPEHLVVFKALAGRPKDVEDAATLLVLYHDIDLDLVRRQVRELAELAEEPELERHLESILATTSPYRNGGIDRSGPVSRRPSARKKAKPRRQVKAPPQAKGRRGKRKGRTD